MDKVIKLISDVDRKIGKMDAIASKGASNMSAKDFIKINRKSNSVSSTMKKVMKEYAPLTPTEAEAREIFKLREHTITLSEKSMAMSRENKAHFDKLHVGGMIKKTLQKNDELRRQFSAVIIEKYPENMKDEATVQEERTMKAFEETMACYSNATGGEDKVDDQADDSD